VTAGQDSSIARCDSEIAEMKAQPAIRPAYLVALGIFDWEQERQLIEKHPELWWATIRNYPGLTRCPFCDGQGTICTGCENAAGCACETPTREMCGGCMGTGDV
jgi:hypothetical protein